MMGHLAGMPVSITNLVPCISCEKINKVMLKTTLAGSRKEVNLGLVKGCLGYKNVYGEELEYLTLSEPTFN